MAEEFNKVFMDQEAGQELAKQAKKYVDDNTVSPTVLATTLADYDKSTEVDTKISTAIAASEKKIFGDGELAEAFDTIQEIGNYLKDHDSVAAGLTAEIGKKVDKETYASDKSTIEGNISQNAADIAELKKSLGTDEGEGESVMDRLDEVESTLEELDDIYQKKSDMGTYATKAELEDYLQEDALEGYLKVSDIQTVSVATVQGWFA